MPLTRSRPLSRIRREALLGRLGTGPHDAPKRRSQHQRPDLQPLEGGEDEERRDHPGHGAPRVQLQTATVPAIRDHPGQGSEQGAEEPQGAHEAHQERRVGEVEHQPAHQDPIDALRQTRGAPGTPHLAKMPVVQGPKEAPRGRRGRRVRVVRACAHHAFLSARVQDESPTDRAPAWPDIVRAYPIRPRDACLLSRWRDERLMLHRRSPQGIHGAGCPASWASGRCGCGQAASPPVPTEPSSSVHGCGIHRWSPVWMRAMCTQGAERPPRLSTIGEARA